MRISDWSSDVCSSDLGADDRRHGRAHRPDRSGGRRRADDFLAGAVDEVRALKRPYNARRPVAVRIALKKSAFHYDLPAELIAQAPLPERSASRLLVVPPGAAGFDDRHVRDLPALLPRGALLSFTDPPTGRPRVRQRVGH